MWRLVFHRFVTTDEQWRRALQAPRILGATFVHAGSKLKGNLAKWMKAIVNA